MALNAVLIGGGGLAGLALGIALRRSGVPVRIVEPAAYPRHRVCGEFISGIRTEELAALGIEDLLTGAARHRETVWFDGEQQILQATLPDAAYGISRYQLDAALAERFVALGGALEIGKRLTGEAEEGTVLATGRPPRDSPWLGLKAHFHDLPLCADLEIHLGKASYVGLTRVENGITNVTGLFRRTTAVTGGQSALAQAVAEAGLPGLAERLRGAQMATASLKGVNRFHLGWQTHRKSCDAAVRVGDASALIPPFTGNGMTMALQSALAAVQPLAAWSRGECSWGQAQATISAAHAALFTHRLRWAGILQTVLLNPLGRRFCVMGIRRGWVSFATLYKKVR